MSINYVVITPVRDEEAHIEHTLESMAKQTIRPAQWVIVNDGSTDRTGELIDQWAGRHSWITVLHRTNRGFRKSGGGVVEAFNEGYRLLNAPDWQYLVKLDGDLTFEPDYFERCFANFAADPKLGVGGGLICHIIDGVETVEKVPDFHVRGATKIYPRACWDAIGGYCVAPGWDTLDEVKANMLGWTSRSFPELRLTHHRMTSSADGVWGGRVKNGRADYVCGYHPLFALLKYVKHLFYPPFVIGGLAGGYGFVTGYLKRLPQVDDRGLIQYLRRQQINKLFGGETIWK